MPSLGLQASPFLPLPLPTNTQASLDHTTHYYPFPADFDASAPLLHIMESAAVDIASGRGLVRGLVYTEKGTLVAATSQEGVIRADFGEGIRPTRETDRNKGKL